MSWKEFKESPCSPWLRGGFNILLAAAALGVWGSSSDASPQEKKEVDLKCASPSIKKGAKVRFEGTAPLPDAAVLRITLFRLQEQALSGRLSPVETLARTALAAVEQKKFPFQAALDGPGRYRAVVELLDEDQTEEIQAKLKTRVGARQWEFKLDLWGDDFISELTQRLLELDGSAHDIGDLVGRFQDACASTDSWKKESKELLKQASQLLKKAGSAEMQRPFTAAGHDLTYVLRNLIASSDLLRWNSQGGYDGVWDYHTNTKQKTFKQDEFSFDVLKKYCADSEEIAGRELGLWMILQLRRVLGAPDRLAGASALRSVVQASAKHAGFSAAAKTFEGWCTELMRGAPDDRLPKLAEELAAMEKSLRGEKDEKKAEK